MAIADPARKYDGFSDLSGGMDSSRSPENIGANFYALGVNITSRYGWPKTRPSFVRRLLAGNAATITKLQTGFYQGSGTYYNVVTGQRTVIVMSGGYVFAIDAVTSAVTEITPAGVANHAWAKHYLCLAETYMVIQNGLDQPLVYDGAKVTQVPIAPAVPNGSQAIPIAGIPVGTLMAYGQGRLFVASPDRRQLIAGDILYGGSTNQVNINRTDPIKGQSNTLVTTATAHGFANGANVTLLNVSNGTVAVNGSWQIANVTPMTFTIPLATSGSGTGGQAQLFNAGQVSDILNFTETTYLNEKGIFTLPTSMGLITGMDFITIQNTLTGVGDLMVWGEHGAATMAVSQPRTSWLDIPFQTVTLAQNGATSPASLVQVNGDIFFRAIDGIRSYRNASVEFSSLYGQASMSTEMDGVMKYDSLDLLTEASAGQFDNRLLFTVSPEALPTNDPTLIPTPAGNYPGIQGPTPVVFNAICTLDFYNSSRISQQGPAAYDGIWTGLQVLKIEASRFGGFEQCFVFHRTPNGLTELWEIQRDLGNGTGTDIYDVVNVDTTVTRTETPIACALETASFDFQIRPMRPYQVPMTPLLRLIRGDMWFGDLWGSSLVNVFWRPDVHPYWFYWGSYSPDFQNQATSVAGSVPIATLPGYAPQISMVTPPKVDDTWIVNRPVHLGHTFQLRIEWTGRVQLQRLSLNAHDIPEAVQGHAPGAAQLQTVPAQGGYLPRPAAESLLGYSSAPAAVFINLDTSGEINLDGTVDSVL